MALPWMMLFDMATKKPETFKRSAQIPDAQLGNTFSGGEDSYGNKAADMVTSNAEKAQSAAEDLKKTADAEAQPGLLDTMLGWINTPSDVTVNAGDARNLIPKKERKEITQDEFDQKIQDKYDEQKAPLPLLGE